MCPLHLSCNKKRMSLVSNIVNWNILFAKRDHVDLDTRRCTTNGLKICKSPLIGFPGRTHIPISYKISIRSSTIQGTTIIITTSHKVISKSLQERAFRVQIKALCKLAFHIMYSLLRVIANKNNLSLFPDMGNDISF